MKFVIVFPVWLAIGNHSEQAGFVLKMWDSPILL